MLPRLPVGRIPRLAGFAAGGRSGPGASPGEFIHDRGAERRKVAGLAAGGQVLAGDALLVDDVPAGVAHIGAEPAGLPVRLV
jgi:hypothetical protein